MSETFVELSAALTGFSEVDLQGTGVAAEYWQTVLKKAGEETANQLLAAWQTVQASAYSLEAALRNDILSQPELGSVARSIIKMWYLGQWEDASNNAFIVSAEAYKQGLVWDVIGAHTQGAKQQGFGVWSLPPKDMTREGSS